MTGKLIFFWDFDTQWGGDVSRSGTGPKNWGMADFTNTERLLEYHYKFQVPACFAVVGAAALPGERPYHDPKLIKNIYKMGHEIASHGMHHEWLPPLGEKKLGEVLRNSKDALEQCIGDKIFTFVPPYNQPFDFFQKGSISLSERKISKQNRIDIPKLCGMLHQTGYQFARIAYANPMQRLLKLVGINRKHKAKLETINGIQTIHLNGKAGFSTEALEHLNRAVKKGGFVVVYGHPHSISGTGLQSVEKLLPFLEKINQYVQESKLEILLPRELCI